MARERPAKRKTKSRPAKSTPAPAPTPTPSEPPRAGDGAFPIVGIGASAGGLEALEQFLQHTAPDSGIAWVVIQHLDPTHKGMMVELLGRITRMPVMQATDRLRVEPDHVYVIPPNAEMSLLHGTLHLLPLAQPRGLNLPIDFFFRSLANDQQERSIGVILSGMGSDGTLGLRAIKEKAGAAFVQSLTSAKFDGMPRSAIDAGLADVIAPVEELPERIIAYRRHAPYIDRRETTIEDKTQSTLEKIFILLRAHTGNDFTLYKRSTILRRVERRMGLHQIDGLNHYLRYLRDNPNEVDLLFKELLIGVTSFFRDPAEWDQLKHAVLPALISARSSAGVVRAWVAGCSTGEEAYSLVMVFKEALDRFKSVTDVSLQVFATDLDRDAIEKARVGLYPDNIVADVSAERLRRFFVREDRGYRIGKDIRECVVFAQQNLISDPPFTKVDIVCCRNLLIYLSADLQKQLIPLFHYCLNPRGALFLGSAETVGTYTSLFSPLDGKTRIYHRREHVLGEIPAEVRQAPFAARPTIAAEPEQAQKPLAANLQMLADRVLVQRFSPLGVLCNAKGDVLYISGRAGKYFEPAVGKANLNVFAMARDGLRYDLTRAFTTATHEGRKVVVRALKVGANGGSQAVDLTVEKLTDPKELAGTVMVVIADVERAAVAKQPPAKARRASEPRRIADLQTELQRAREEVQTTREEMQTSQEELKSSNEELQSTNEELQSTNEELTTSKEEMQSLNEELQTVNHELQAKVDELSRSNNDMKNLLNSTEIATLFLDGDLNVRRFTTPTTKIINLIPADAGRPITDITTDLEYEGLTDDAREVLRTLVFTERRVDTRDGRCFLVRIMPYRTLDNVIDGLVITFTDASTSRALEEALAQQASQLRQLGDSMPGLVWSCLPDGSCDYFSPQWLEYTGVAEKEQLRWGWLDQIHAEDREHVRGLWKAALRAGKRADLDFRIRSARGEYHWFATRWIPLFSARGDVLRWYAASSDAEGLKRTYDRLIAREARG